MIRRVVALVLSLLIFTLEGRAQEEQKGRPFGTYTETYTDLSVKTKNGSIVLTRVWDGWKKRWFFNPQYDALELRSFKYDERLGKIVASEVRRGTEEFLTLDSVPVQCPPVPVVPSATPKPRTDVIQGIAPVQPHIEGFGVLSCEKKDLNAGGALVVDSCDGSQGDMVYVSFPGGPYSRYSPDGRLQDFGVGTQLVGRVVYSDGSLTGIADVDLERRVTLDRDAQGNVTRIHTPEGKEVRYGYFPNGALSDVHDLNGGRTHYEYNGDGSIRTITFFTGDDEATEESSLSLTYHPDGRIKSIRDSATGEVRTFSHEYLKSKQVYIETIRHPDGRVERRYSDGSGRIFQVDIDGEPTFRVSDICEDTVIVDDQDRMTYIDRDAWERVRRVIYPDRSVETYEHSHEHWPRLKYGKLEFEGAKPWGVTAYTSPAGRRIEYLRDATGKVVEATERLEASEGGGVRKWNFEFDKFQRLLLRKVTVDGELAFQETNKWEEIEGGYQLSQSDTRGKTWRYRYDKAFNLKEVEDPLGSIWRYSYNAAGYPTYAKDPEGYEQWWRYNKRGNLSEYRERYETGKDEARVLYRYYPNGLLKEVVDPLGKSWRYEYDRANRIVRSIDPEGEIEETHFDKRGRPTESWSGKAGALEKLQTIAYERAAPKGVPSGVKLIATAKGGVREVELDVREQVRVVTERDSTGEVRTKTFYEYNRDGAVTKIRTNDGTRDFESLYTYDGLGRVKSESTPGWGTTSYNYRNAGRHLQVVQPGGGTTEYFFGVGGLLEKQVDAEKKETRFEYDDAGRVASIYTPRGSKAEHLYDKVGNLTRLTSSIGDSSQGWQWQYNLRGDVIAHRDGGTSTTYLRDALGRTASSETDYGHFKKSHGYSYLSNGAVSEYRAPSGGVYSYKWNLFGLPETITVPGEGVITYRYKADDPRKVEEILYPGGTSRTFTYRGDEVEEVALKNRAGVLLERQRYRYGKLGELQGIETEEGNFSLTHDEGLRLTSFTTPEGIMEKYHYDELGRRSPQDGEAWQYNQLGAVTKTHDAEYTYDANGNRTSEKRGQVVRQYHYDALDRLSRVTEGDRELGRYQYDALNRRTLKETSEGKRHFYYTETGLAAELDAQGGISEEHLFSTGASWSTDPLITRTFGADGTPQKAYFYATDLRGAPTKAFDKQGKVAWSGRYSAFGEAEVGGTGFKNNLRLPGQYFDQESGFHHNFFREYDPQLGAYTSQDSEGIFSTGPNRYHYGGGSPFEYTDPEGRYAVVAVWLAAEAWSGFPTFRCANGLLRGCFSEATFSACKEMAIAAALGWGIGKVAYLIGKAAIAVGNAARWVGGKAAPYVGEVWSAAKAFPGQIWAKLGRGSACFVAGTLVKTEHGDRAIEDIKKGDKVWAADPHTGKWELKEVIEPLVREYEGDMITLEVNGETIEATGNHPFWVVAGEGLGARAPPEELEKKDQVLTDKGRWVEARELKRGDRLHLRANEHVTVATISSRTTRATVYNLRVAELQTFSVGKSGVLVHNNPCGATFWNWKSVKAFGHTFSTHGQGGKVLQRLTDRARLEGPQGQWLNNVEAAQIIKNVKPVSGKAVDFDIPPGLGRVIKPDGSKELTELARVVFRQDGSIKSAFPIPRTP